MTEIRRVHSLTPIQQLYAAAKKITQCIDCRELQDAVDVIEAAAEENDHMDAIRQRAAETYVVEPKPSWEITIEEHGLSYHNDNTGRDAGYWVAAWLWVPGGDEEDEDGD